MDTEPVVTEKQSLPEEISGRDNRRRPVALLCKKKFTTFHDVKPSAGVGLFHPHDSKLSQAFNVDKKPEARPVCPHGELDSDLRSILVESCDTQEQRVQKLRQYLKGHEELRLRETGWISFRPRSPGSNATAFARAGLGPQGTSVLAQSLSALDCTITNLDLTDNSLGPNEVSLLAKAIASNRSLKAIHMSGNRASVFGGAEIALTLSLNNRIQELDLARASLGYQGAECLAKHLGHCRLTALDLSDNSLGDKGIIAVGQSLGSNFTLQLLELAGNALNDEGASAVARLLSRLSQRSPMEKQLQHVGLQRNKIGAKGTSEIASALSLGCGVQTLDIRANFIRDKGALALAEAVKAKKSNLQRVDVDGCGVSAAALSELNDTLELRKSGGLVGFQSRISSKETGRSSDGSVPNRTLVAQILGRPPGSRTVGTSTRVTPGGLLL